MSSQHYPHLFSLLLTFCLALIAQNWQNKNFISCSTKFMESPRHAFRVDSVFSELSFTFLAAHVVVFKLGLDSFLDFGPLSDFGLDLWVKLIPHFSLESFFLLDKIPDGFVLDLEKFDPSFVFIKNHLLFGQFSWQIVRINIDWRFDWLWN